MPKKKNEAQDDGAIVNAAKAVGTAAGKIAALAGVKPATPKTRIGRLVKALKARLPRKVKKAAQKAAAKKTAPKAKK
jgi:hypothetical protein